MNRVLTTMAKVPALLLRASNALRWLPPTVARLTVGLIFLQSGWGKIHNLQFVTNYFTELGIPAPAFQATLASTTEFVCGTLVLLGLATRFAAVPLMVVMAVAIRTAQWAQVDSLGALFGLVEFTYIALLLWLAIAGPGVVSLDGLIGAVARRQGWSAMFTSTSGKTSAARA
jgi:putative oxidoreductase